MAHVVMYSTTVCPYCVAAERLLKQRGVEMMDQKPRIGLRGKKIAMTMPSALNGITIELSEP